MSSLPREGDTSVLVGWLVSRMGSDPVSVRAASRSLAWSEEKVRAILSEIAIDGLSAAAANLGIPVAYDSRSAQLVGEHSTVAHPFP